MLTKTSIYVMSSNLYKSFTSGSRKIAAEENCPNPNTHPNPDPNPYLIVYCFIWLMQLVNGFQFSYITFLLALLVATPVAAVFGTVPLTRLYPSI